VVEIGLEHRGRLLASRAGAESAQAERNKRHPGDSQSDYQVEQKPLAHETTILLSAKCLSAVVAIIPAVAEATGIACVNLGHWLAHTGSGRSNSQGQPLAPELLVEAGVAARRTNTYLGARFRRLAASRGSRRAAVALAHSIIAIAYHLLTKHQEYRDLGANYFDERQRDQVRYRLTRRLEALGFEVRLEPAA
jgi:hypothetical protein